MQPSNLYAVANGKILILAVPYSDKGKKTQPTHTCGVHEMWNRTESIVPAFEALPLFASTDGVIDLMYNMSLYIQNVHMTDADKICSFTERNDNSAPFKLSKHITLDMRM